ncbi:hypothetical protein quinque_015990 [Culex quinquefasciatus]
MVNNIADSFFGFGGKLVTFNGTSRTVVGDAVPLYVQPEQRRQCSAQEILPNLADLVSGLSGYTHRDRVRRRAARVLGQHHRQLDGIYETEHTSNNRVTNIKLTRDKVVAARLSGRIDFLQLKMYTQGRKIDWGFTSAHRHTHIRTGSAGSFSMFQQPNGPASIHHASEKELRCILEFHQHGTHGEGVRAA